MASIKFLWSNRAVFKFGSIKFCRAWGKRLFSFPELWKRNATRRKLSRGGAFIENTSEIGKVKVEGNKSLLKVGNFTFLGQINIALHDNVIIGNYVCINDGVEILTASHDISDPEWKHIKGAIVIDDYSWIGTGAMILPGVTIGRGAVVGARAVVTKSVSPGAIVVGNPAKAINKKRCENFNYNPCEFLSANRAWLIG